MLELALGMSRSSPKESPRGSSWHVGRKESMYRGWYRVHCNWSTRGAWGNVGVEAGGREKVAEGLGRQAKELGLYPVGDRSPLWIVSRVVT